MTGAEEDGDARGADDQLVIVDAQGEGLRTATAWDSSRIEFVLDDR
jgi:hypothetical protein